MTPAGRPPAPGPRPPSAARHFLWVGVVVLLLLATWLVLWLAASDSPAVRTLARLYHDPDFLRRQVKHVVRQSAGWGPLIFMGVQALQVLIAPIPGEVTGLLGGFLFGEWLGFLYSTIGLTAGSLAAFVVGRWLGAEYVERLVQPHVWGRMGFLIRAEGAILCFVVFLIPGLPKDITCYLFGLSAMPFGVFALVSTLGRMPGTWALSANGAKTAAGNYVGLAILLAATVAVALPLYYYRDRIVQWVHPHARHG